MKLCPTQFDKICYKKIRQHQQQRETAKDLHLQTPNKKDTFVSLLHLTSLKHIELGQIFLYENEYEILLGTYIDSSEHVFAELCECENFRI